MGRNRVVDEISRTKLCDAYVNNMVTFLTMTRGLSVRQAEEFVAKIVGSRVKAPEITVIETVSPGKLIRRTLSFKQFSDVLAESIMSPSGSLYRSANAVRSVVASLLDAGSELRSKLKKLKFKALASGDYDTSDRCDGEQNTVKTKCNAFPGALGFPGFVAYDKGSYNAVTSTARMLISNSFTCCEQLLGGNLPLFSLDELYNLAVISMRYGPSSKTIDKVMSTYNLKQVSKIELQDYLLGQLKMHSACVINPNEVQLFFDSIPTHVVQFMFYHSNLKHIITLNEQTFRPVIEKMFNFDAFSNLENIDPLTFFEQDGNIMAIVTTALSEQIGTTKVSDIPSQHPELSKACINLHRHISSTLGWMEELFDCFIYHDIDYQVTLHRSRMQRKAVVVSDTDSVIYTAREWGEWYSGCTDKVDGDWYNISALVTYWLTVANADTMAKFMVGVGATGNNILNLQMKNEFLYPSLLLFDLKKVYAGIIKIQEGVVLPNLKPDIKGALIKGVGASLPAKEFASKLLIDDVLYKVIDGTVSATELIDKTVIMEATIAKVLLEGRLDYLPITAVGTADKYADADATSFFYAKAWNEIFGGRFGEIRPPDKLPLLKLVKPNETYLARLKVEYPDTHSALTKFVAEHKGRYPSAIFIEPNQQRIPPELLPLINIREIIYANMSPVYLVLESLNISCGHDSSRRMLLGDIYGN
jgi:hypothetical protein